MGGGSAYGVSSDPMRGLEYQRAQEEFNEFQGARPLRMQQQAFALGQAGMGLRMLPFQERASRMQAEEYFGGAGLRGQQQELAGLETGRSIGRTKFESQYDPSSSDWFRERPEATKLRQYQMGREAEDLERMKMGAEKSKLQSQMSAQPYMDKIRQGIMSSMGGRFGLPSMASTQQSPSWMRSYQTPSFPRY
jgi:hypothetical protein